MSVAKIDMIKGVRSPEEIKKLADVVQKVILQKFNAPPRDRYQIITQHEAYEIISEDTNLNLPHSNKLIFIQIFQQERDAELKQAVYKGLEKECGVPGTNLIVSCSANTKEDWSFGIGRAQFLTGEL